MSKQRAVSSSSRSTRQRAISDRAVLMGGRHKARLRMSKQRAVNSRSRATRQRAISDRAVLMGGLISDGQQEAFWHIEGVLTPK
jgi:hypothetical protein